jgi:hypothetical protein
VVLEQSNEGSLTPLIDEPGVVARRRSFIFH